MSNLVDTAETDDGVVFELYRDGTIHIVFPSGNRSRLSSDAVFELFGLLDANQGTVKHDSGISWSDV